MIETINIDTFEIIGNFVLVKLDANYDFVKVDGPMGSKVELQLVDYTKSAAQLQSITGTVLKVPKKLQYHGCIKKLERNVDISVEEYNTLMRTSLPHDCDLNLKEGDEIVFDIKDAIAAEELGLLVDLSGFGDYAVMMPYESIYAKKSNTSGEGSGKVEALNGYIIFKRDQKPNEWKTESGLWVVEKIDKYGSKYATIIHADKPVRDYIEKGAYDDNVELKAGDRVILKKGFGFRMADDTFAGDLLGMEIVRYKHILALV